MWEYLCYSSRRRPTGTPAHTHTHTYTLTHTPTLTLTHTHTYTHTHTHTHTYIYIYIYIYIYGEMFDFGKPDKMIKIIGKVDKRTRTTNSAILIFRSLLKKKEIVYLNEVGQEYI